MQPIILCISSYFKGGLFIEACKALGCHTILVTVQATEHEEWPRHAIDEFFMLPLPNLAHEPDVTHAISYLMRDRAIDRIVALDDYDVEVAANLREHLRMPGMGASTARFFRDKLAMRVQAQERGLTVPAFVPVLNYDRLRAYMAQVPPPWVLKPRSEASSMGIKKVHNSEEVWRTLDQLGDRQSFYVLEQFVPGDVYHVDSVIWNGQVLFAACSKYHLPPMTVYQGGGVFATRTLAYDSDEEQALQAFNRGLVQALGMVRGVTHAEFIGSHDNGHYYFLEVAARVGGAGIDRLVEYATNVNPWVEWARVEVAHVRGEEYQLPPVRHEHAGLVVSLARQEWPDMSGYNDPELVWRMVKRHHAGFIVASPSADRVQALLDNYMLRIAQDFTATAPPRERPPDRVE